VSLILPGRNKQFLYSTSFGIEWKLLFDYLWSQAAEALKQADNLVICGYSMPTADKRACDMIRNPTNEHANVVIVSAVRGNKLLMIFATQDTEAFPSTQRLF
jgi:hypothetical protein